MTVEKKAVPNKKKKDEAKKPEMVWHFWFLQGGKASLSVNRLLNNSHQ